MLVHPQFSTLIRLPSICIFRTAALLSSSPLKRGLSVHAAAMSSQPDNHSLFAYTSGRWLCNDEKQRRLRYTPFNVTVLEQIACHTVSAQRCVNWSKIGEGSFNKVFLLHFDNGRDAVVRIPCPIIGNVERTISSEVATMEYVREQWDAFDTVPKPPKVLAWNVSYFNPAETPYIILEYAPGVTLFSRWALLEGETAGAAMKSIFSMEKAFLRQPFSQHGSIYFTEEVSQELQHRPLYPAGQSLSYPSDDSPQKQLPSGDYLSRKYKIGPTADREWYRGAYGSIGGDRGPWQDMQSYLQNAATFQLLAIDAGVDFDSPHIRSKPPDIPHLRHLLEICIHLAPLIVPEGPSYTTPVLTHPDMNLNNFIVAPEGRAYVQNTIDWQCAKVAPFCQQCGMPACMTYSGEVIPVPTDGSIPPWPENFDDMSEEQQQYVRIHHRFACRHRLYAKMCMQQPLRLRAWGLPHAAELADIGPLCTRLIADGPLDLRGVLIQIQQKWSAIGEYVSAAAAAPCPVDLTAEEIAAHEAEEQAQAEYTKNKYKLFAQIGCDPFGEVSNEDYERARVEMEKCRANWDEAAMKGPFPFFEGAYSYYLT